MPRKKSKGTIAKELAAVIKTSAADIARQIVESYRERREQITAGIKNNEPGSTNFLAYQQALAKLDKAERDELASRGLVPTQLSIATKPSFHFHAEVSTKGVTRVFESGAEAAEDAAIRRRFDEEYS